MPMSLVECPAGLFLFGFQSTEQWPSVGFKTEYGTHSAFDMDVYCVESGEVFWGGTKTPLARGELQVMPAKLEWVEV